MLKSREWRQARRELDTLTTLAVRAGDATLASLSHKLQDTIIKIERGTQQDGWELFGLMSLYENRCEQLGVKVQSGSRIVNPAMNEADAQACNMAEWYMASRTVAQQEKVPIDSLPGFGVLFDLLEDASRAAENDDISAHTSHIVSAHQAGDDDAIIDFYRLLVNACNKAGFEMDLPENWGF